MLRRVHILLMVFVSLSVGALLFGAAYRGLMGARLQAYGLQISRCPYLSEALCARHSGCQPYYEPARGGRPALEFRACQVVTAQTASAHPLCSKTGGTWRRSQFGDYCDCSATGRAYLVDKGCR